MLSKKMEKALNEQIAMEGAASNKYLAMSCWCDSQGLDGSAQFFLHHSEEERMHMMKLVQYIQDADGKAIIPAFDKPKTDYKDIQEVVNAAYQSEKKVSKSIYDLVDLSLKDKDHQTHNFLQWYVSEQLEEEVLMRKLIDKIKIIGKGPTSLFYIDQALEQVSAAEAAAEGA